MHPLIRLAVILKGNLQDFFAPDAHRWEDSPYRYVDDKAWNTCRGVQFEAPGWVILGNGNFSLALAHADFPGVVVKCGIRGHDAAAAYAAWARDNPGKHVPRVLDIQSIGGWYFVVMPKYAPFQYAEHHELMFSAAQGIIEYGYAKEEYPDVPAELLETAERIRAFFKGVATFDLHAENIMIDPSNDTVIITDPVSYSHKENDLEQPKPKPAKVPLAKKLREVCLPAWRA